MALAPHAPAPATHGDYAVTAATLHDHRLAEHLPRGVELLALTLSPAPTPPLTKKGTPRRKRGFGALKERAAEARLCGDDRTAEAIERRIAEIAGQGGRAAQARGVGHRFDAEQARAAGRLSGQSRRGRRVTEPPAASVAA